MGTRQGRHGLELEIGSVLQSKPRHMTRERMRWYVDIQPTVAADDGRIHRGGPTIHDDDEYARSQGLPGIIADGMISTNWIQSLLLDAFGPDYLRNGRLQTKYIRPIYEDQLVVSCARVRSIARTEAETRYELQVWCEDDTKAKLTVGQAVVTVRR